MNEIVNNQYLLHSSYILISRIRQKRKKQKANKGMKEYYTGQGRSANSKQIEELKGLPTIFEK